MDADGIRVAIGTNAMGKPAGGYEIAPKLEAAKRHGYHGVEVAIECLEHHAESDAFFMYSSHESRLRAAAADIYQRATALRLEIVALNPFRAYDGLAVEEDVVAHLEEAELWLQLCDELHAPILQACLDPSL